MKPVSDGIARLAHQPVPRLQTRETSGIPTGPDVWRIATSNARARIPAGTRRGRPQGPRVLGDAGHVSLSAALLVVHGASADASPQQWLNVT